MILGSNFSISGRATVYRSRQYHGPNSQRQFASPVNPVVKKRARKLTKKKKESEKEIGKDVTVSGSAGARKCVSVPYSPPDNPRVFARAEGFRHSY